jgi:tetratricopeptide (TPR) repeat protein
MKGRILHTVSIKLQRWFAASQRLAIPCSLHFFIFLASIFRVAAQATPATDEQFQHAAEALRSGDLQAAAAGFSEVVRGNPNFAEAHLNLGLVQMELGKNEEAIASLEKALALKPKLRGPNLFIGIADYRLNRFDKAIEAFKKETANFPADASGWMWLGVSRLAQDRPEDAVQALDKAVKLAPENVDILYHRGRAHLLVSKDSYSRMFKADPRSWRVHLVLAQADSEADRHDEAVAEYQMAIKLAPDEPGLHENLGTEYRLAGKPELAQAELRRELEIDPNNYLACYKLGTLLVEQGDGANGKGLIESALRQNPSLKDASYYLGRAEMQLGNDESAIENLKKATQADSDPDVVEQAWYQLGTVYRRMHRMEQAQKALAIFQRLKDESTARQQQTLQKKREAQHAPDVVPNGPAPN